MRTGKENIKMFKDDNKKFLFIHVPKTAGTSISVLFKDIYGLSGGQRLDPAPEIFHGSFSSMVSQDKKYLEYFSFGFVRNPWDRLLSLYLDFSQNRIHTTGSISAKEKESIDLVVSYKNFKNFVISFPDSKIKDDVHFRPQKPLLHTEEGCVSFIGRYEKIAEDWNHICEAIGIPKHGLPHHRATNHSKYQNYYTKEMKEVVYNHFKEDIDFFNYSF